MPYIKEKDRDRLSNDNYPQTPGELNYLITTLCIQYLDELEESYSNYNSVIGALECAKLEMYRRAVSRYEDQKIKENGDVYES